MYLMLLALLFSPFYLWKSGLPQLSHFFAATAAGYRYAFAKPKRLYFEKAWGAQAFFIIYSFVVALVVFYFYRDAKTLIAPTYYLFGFLVFLEIITQYVERGKIFLSVIFWMHMILIISVLMITTLGLGRSYIDASAGLRVKVFFNNPNQMANWTVWVVVILSTAGRALYRSWLPGVCALAASVIIIYYSFSRAGFVATAVFLAFYITLGLNYFALWYKKHKNADSKKWILLIAIIIIILLIAALAILLGDYFKDGTTGINSLDRIILRIVKTKADITRQFKVRGYDRLWQYPQYLLFGAGEGARERFAEKTSYTQYEVHSSWAGLLFNYGLVGLSLFTAFIYALLKKIKYIWFKLILLAPFFFGFTNYNIRNWYFWVGLALVYSCALFLQEQEFGEDKKVPLELSTLTKSLFSRTGA